MNHVLPKYLEVFVLLLLLLLCYYLLLFWLAFLFSNDKVFPYHIISTSLQMKDYLDL